MNTQQINSTDKQSQLTLELLQAIDQQDDISQRHLAQKMGVALGLANSYLKRCVKKGWIKMTTAPANRYLYYLTPNGFAEKARLTGEFLSTSLALFRQSGDVYRQVFDDCLRNQQQRILFAGISDLTEIAYMRSLQSDISVTGVYQPGVNKTMFFDLPVFAVFEDCNEFDCVVLTSMEQTAELASSITRMLASKQDKQSSDERVIVPSLLLNMHYRNSDE